MAVRVVTDSTTYLPQRPLDDLSISVVSLFVTFAEGDSVAEVDLTPEAFYSRLAKSPDLPRSSQPPTGEIVDAFRHAVAEGHDVVGVFLSSAMSGTFAGAEAAREIVLAESPDARIELVDSRSNCMQLGFPVLAAARAAAEDLSAEECAAAARGVIPRSRFLFTPGTLEYLRRGGRIGNASALVGAMLQVRPILTVTDGMTATVKKVRTTRRAVDDIVAMAEADIARYGLDDIAVHHIDAPELGAEVAKRFEADLGREVPVLPIGAVIGTHVGPGTIGLVYVTKEPLGPVGEAAAQ